MSERQDLIIRARALLTTVLKSDRAKEVLEYLCQPFQPSTEETFSFSDNIDSDSDFDTFEQHLLDFGNVPKKQTDCTPNAIIAALEERLGRPVVAANQASLWRALDVAGVKAPVAGYGRLLAG